MRIRRTLTMSLMTFVLIGLVIFLSSSLRPAQAPVLSEKATERLSETGLILRVNLTNNNKTTMHITKLVFLPSAKITSITLEDEPAAPSITGDTTKPWDVKFNIPPLSSRSIVVDMVTYDRNTPPEYVWVAYQTSTFNKAECTLDIALFWWRSP